MFHPETLSGWFDSTWNKADQNCKVYRLILRGVTDTSDEGLEWIAV
jgi:hypothetical protein